MLLQHNDVVRSSKRCHMVLPSYLDAEHICMQLLSRFHVAAACKSQATKSEPLQSMTEWLQQDLCMETCAIMYLHACRPDQSFTYRGEWHSWAKEFSYARLQPHMHVCKWPSMILIWGRLWCFQLAASAAKIDQQTSWLETECKISDIIGRIVIGMLKKSSSRRQAFNPTSCPCLDAQWLETTFMQGLMADMGLNLMLPHTASLGISMMLADSAIQHELRDPTAQVTACACLVFMCSCFGPGLIGG